MHADSLLAGRDLAAAQPRRSRRSSAAARGRRRAPVLHRRHRRPARPQHRAQRERRLRSDDAARDGAALAVRLARPARARGAAGRSSRGARSPRSDGALVPVRSRADLEALLARRAQGGGPIGALLGIEGAHALEGDVANLDVVFERGFRMIGLTHFFDNEFAGSAHGVQKGGLTDLGRELVRRMQERGVLVDLAHVSPRRGRRGARDGDEAHRRLARRRRRAPAPTRARSRTQQVRGIAAGGGVIGIGYWETAICGREPRHVVAAMRYVIGLVGDDHVGPGLRLRRRDDGRLRHQPARRADAGDARPKDSRTTRSARSSAATSCACCARCCPSAERGAGPGACAPDCAARSPRSRSSLRGVRRLRVEPVIDLTPWSWTWSQTALGGCVIRYGYPDEPLEPEVADDAATLAAAPLDAACCAATRPARPAARDGLARATRFASYRYGCAREDRGRGRRLQRHPRFLAARARAAARRRHAAGLPASASSASTPTRRRRRTPACAISCATRTGASGCTARSCSRRAPASRTTRARSTRGSRWP